MKNFRKNELAAGDAYYFKGRKFHGQKVLRDKEIAKLREFKFRELFLLKLSRILQNVHFWEQNLQKRTKSRQRSENGQKIDFLREKKLSQIFDRNFHEKGTKTRKARRFLPLK